MELTQQLFLLLGVGAVGMSAIVSILHRQRVHGTATAESPFAMSTEGETRCPKCAMGNMWTDRTCISCGSPLGH